MGPTLGSAAAVLTSARPAGRHPAAPASASGPRAGTRVSVETHRRAETARLLVAARIAEGEERAALENEVIALNMQVAKDIARRYHGRGISADDLDQVAYVGLIKAVRGFDPRLGDDFLSFAVPTLRGEIRRYFRDAGWTVRPPRAVQEIQARIGLAESELCQSLGRSPRPSEIAAHLDVNLELVLDAMNATGLFTPVSLDAPRGAEGDGASPADTMGDLDPAFATAEARLAVKPLMGDLCERERRILELRFFENRTQSQIGEELGVSQEQVSRLLTGILGRLRRSLAIDAA